MLTIRNLVKTFGTARSEKHKRVHAVDGISFEVEDGELFTLLGPSGCGKTTTLRCIAGLEMPDAGDLRVSSDADFAVGAKVVVAARPEHIDLSTTASNGGAANRWRGRVEARAFLGEVVDHVVSVGPREIRARCNSKVSIPAPTEVTVTFHEEAFSLIPAGE